MFSTDKMNDIYGTNINTINIDKWCTQAHKNSDQHHFHKVN